MTLSIVEEVIKPRSAVIPRRSSARDLPRCLRLTCTVLALLRESFCDSIFVVCLVGSIPKQRGSTFPSAGGATCDSPARKCWVASCPIRVPEGLLSDSYRREKSSVFMRVF